MEANEFNRLVEQYMLLDKKTLAELLAMKELAGRLDIPVVPSYPNTPIPPYPPYNPWWPGIGDYPWWPQVWYTTKTTDGKEYNDFTPTTKCDLNRHDLVEQTSTNPNSQHIRTEEENNSFMDRIRQFS